MSPVHSVGEWAPDEPQMAAALRDRHGVAGTFGGLRIVLRRINGVTDKDMLTEPLYFQCPPLEDFTIEFGADHTDYATVREGQFSRRGGRMLRTWSVSTLAVDFLPSWVLPRTVQSMERIQQRLAHLCESGSPFLFVAHHDVPREMASAPLVEVGPKIERHATLRRVRVTEKAGEPDARYFDLDFTEYRVPTVHRQHRGKRKPTAQDTKFPVVVQFDKDGSATETKGGLPNIKHTKDDVTLAGLARLYYGDPSKWRVIVRANAEQHPDLKNLGQNEPIINARSVKPDTKLRIPKPNEKKK